MTPDALVADYWGRRFQDAAAIEHHREQNKTIAEDFIGEARRRKPFAAALSADSLLEIGCGTGELAYLIDRTYSPRVLRATDFAPGAVKAAYDQHPNINFAVFDILKDWPSVYSGFATVVASNVLEHFRNPWLVLDRMLEIGRQALVLTPYDQRPVDGYDGEGGAGHVTRFTKATYAPYRLIDSFTFATNGWRHVEGSKEPLQLAVLIEAKPA
jgi:SAM-dependent methyltransferase